ncbi:hypothetical protein [Streptomyces sp. NPDC026673]|uniref:hypothetical protein n=1 Tax=Streptomyces sp. NPDC026673 TaxID=3155724 RepID=UPI0033CD25A3
MSADRTPEEGHHGFRPSTPGRTAVEPECREALCAASAATGARSARLSGGRAEVSG